MVEKKITRKVISKKTAVVEKPQPEADAQKFTKSKKVCFFCQSKTSPLYTDMVTLRRFITDRAKITSHLKTYVCSKHQRVVTKQIKYARHLSLLPFVPKV